MNTSEHNSRSPVLDASESLSQCAFHFADINKRYQELMIVLYQKLEADFEMLRAKLPAAIIHAQRAAANALIESSEYGEDAVLQTEYSINCGRDAFSNWLAYQVGYEDDNMRTTIISAFSSLNTLFLVDNRHESLQFQYSIPSLPAPSWRHIALEIRPSTELPRPSQFASKEFPYANVALVLFAALLVGALNPFLAFLILIIGGLILLVKFLDKPFSQSNSNEIPPPPASFVHRLSYEQYISLIERALCEDGETYEERWLRYLSNRTAVWLNYLQSFTAYKWLSTTGMPARQLNYHVSGWYRQVESQGQETVSKLDSSVGYMLDELGIRSKVIGSQWILIDQVKSKQTQLNDALKNIPGEDESASIYEVWLCGSTDAMLGKFDSVQELISIVRCAEEINIYIAQWNNASKLALSELGRPTSLPDSRVNQEFFENASKAVLSYLKDERRIRELISNMDWIDGFKVKQLITSRNEEIRAWAEKIESRMPSPSHSELVIEKTPLPWISLDHNNLKGIGLEKLPSLIFDSFWSSKLCLDFLFPMVFLLGVGGITYTTVVTSLHILWPVSIGVMSLITIIIINIIHKSFRFRAVEKALRSFERSIRESISEKCCESIDEFLKLREVAASNLAQTAQKLKRQYRTEAIQHLSHSLAEVEIQIQDMIMEMNQRAHSNDTWWNMG